MRRITMIFSIALSLSMSAHATDWLTEIFYGTFDLNNTSVIFTPDGSDNYTVSAESITNLPVDWTSGDVNIGAPNYHNLGDNGYVGLGIGGNFTYFGTSWNGVYLNSNGNLTFGGYNRYWPDIDDQFAVPRISFFWNHLNTNLGGTIYHLSTASPWRFVITYEDVANAHGSAETVTVQCELFLEEGLGHPAGTIRFSYIDTPYFSGHNTYVGLSAGQGYDASTFILTDFSSYLGGGGGGDLDGDGIPDSWETTYFGHYTNCNPLVDSDLDSFNNYREYIAGTIPTDNTSYFHITSSYLNSTDMVFDWNAVTGRVYTIQWTDDLGTPFTPIASGITYPQNSYTSNVSTSGYYKVEVGKL